MHKLGLEQANFLDIVGLVQAKAFFIGSFDNDFFAHCFMQI